MKGRLFLSLVLVTAGAMASAGCKKKAAPKVLVPPLLTGTTAKTAPPDPLPQPDIELPPEAAAPLNPPETVLPPPPVTKQQPKRVRRTSHPASSPTKAEEDVDAAPPQPMPQLGEVLSTQQRRQYARSTQESLDRTRRIVSAIQRRPLDARQTEVLGQIQGFMRQAIAATKTDLVVARNLVERAEVLARDLLRSLN